MNRNIIPATLLAVIVGYSLFAFKNSNPPVITEDIAKVNNDGIIFIRPLTKDEMATLGNISVCNIAYDELVTLDIPYVTFAGDEARGLLIIQEKHIIPTTAVFNYLYDIRFPINKIDLAGNYQNNDETIMDNNITTSFNCRTKTGGKSISNHAYGAIDINPMQNPYQNRTTTLPKQAKYDIAVAGTITPDIASNVKSFGYMWGGDWNTIKDYQHFELLEK